MPLHTQREEDIGYFQKHFIQDSAENGVSYEEIRIMKFISNIYIKIAERNVAYWQYLTDRLQKDYDYDGKDFTSGALKIAKKELVVAQEELNKLKSNPH